jgi:hypothetical protein
MRLVSESSGLDLETRRRLLQGSLLGMALIAMVVAATRRQEPDPGLPPGGTSTTGA